MIERTAEKEALARQAADEAAQIMRAQQVLARGKPMRILISRNWIELRPACSWICWGKSPPQSHTAVGGAFCERVRAIVPDGMKFSSRLLVAGGSFLCVNAFTAEPAASAPAASSARVVTEASEPNALNNEEAKRYEKLRKAIEKGALMEEIAALKDSNAKTPEEAIYALKAGNSRFFGGHAKRPELSVNERRAQILEQTPFAVILGCSDSRVPVEFVYDQGLGDLFTVRVAGEILEPATAGSIEYAVAHLKTKVLVVMGHEGCGAVKAAMMSDEQLKDEPENVKYLVSRISPAVRNLPAIRDERAKMREAVIANIRLQVAKAKENPVIKAAVDKKELAVIGAYYEISSGQVDFLETDEELRVP